MSILGDIFGFLGNRSAKKSEDLSNETNKNIALKNMAQQEARFKTGRSDAMSDWAARILETIQTNKDSLEQRDFLRKDTEAMRGEARQGYDDVLRNLLASFQDVQDDGDNFDTEAVYDDSSAGDTDLLNMLSSRSASRDRMAKDAFDAEGLRKRAESELFTPGMSSGELAALISQAGASGLNKGFDKANSAAAIQSMRTGGDGSEVMSEIAREQADAFRDNDVNAILQGIQGSESLTASKQQRLSPIIAAMSGRGTAMPSGNEEVAASQIRTGRRDAKSSAINANSQANAQRRAALRQGRNSTKAGLINSRTNAIASISPMRTAGTQIKMPGQTELARSGGMNFSYMGSPVPTNSYNDKPNLWNARLYKDIGGSIDDTIGDVAKLFGGFGG
jgi:hypothetical protein